jgi:hypothetical protein
MKKTGWDVIHALTETALHAEEAKVSAWLRREAEINAAIARLDGDAGPGVMTDPVAFRAGADLRWQAWCDRRRSELLAELALIRYRKHAAEEAMRHAARRSIATRAILGSERARLARRAALRAEREGLA